MACRTRLKKLADHGGALWLLRAREMQRLNSALEVRLGGTEGAGAGGGVPPVLRRGTGAAAAAARR